MKNMPPGEVIQVKAMNRNFYIFVLILKKRIETACFHYLTNITST